jgi:GGDEF domain-containing protein
MLRTVAPRRMTERKERGIGTLSRRFSAAQLGALEWGPVIAPRALAGHRLRPLAAAAVALGVSVVVYHFEREAGFAILAVLGLAAGWLLAAGVARLIAVAEVATLIACLWAGFLPWPAAVFEACLLTALIGLAYVSAERELVARRGAAQQRRLEGLTLLVETVESLAAATDRDEALKIAVRAAARGISRPGFGRTAHAAFHAVAGDQLKITVVHDEPPEREAAVGFEHPIIRNQAARGAIRIGRPAFVRPDHMSGPLRELADRLGWQVLIMSPVYCGGALQGLLAATARDGPAVDSLQQYFLGTLARLTSLSLEYRAAMEARVPATADPAPGEVGMPVLLPGIVDELRDAVKPIKTQVLDLRASRNRGQNGGEEVAHAFGKLDDLISVLASRTAIDAATGVLSRELGLAALERDVLKARRSQARSHCVAVVSVATSEAANSGEIIRLVADRLRSSLRREDLIFRYAEDEFVCSFADMDNTDAWPILHRIQTQLATELGYTPFTIGLTPVSLEQTAG